MKPENKFRIWFEKNMRGHMSVAYPALRVRTQKHADAVTSGIPDIDVSIEGITIWLEVKLVTGCKTERKLHVSPLQLAQLNGLAQAGVPAGLLVGLPLGPRKGYLVALYHTTIPTVAHRDDFRLWTTAVHSLVSMAQARAEKSAAALSRVSVIGAILDEASLDVVVDDENGC